MSPSPAFPRLASGNHREIGGTATPNFNCVAWAAGDDQHWWQPGTYWLPTDWPGNDFGIGALERAFRELGYEDCGTDVVAGGLYGEVVQIMRRPR